MAGIDESKVARVLAWLMKEEEVDAAAIERAVGEARSMRLGESVTLDGGDEALRRVFVFEQTRRLRD